VENALLRGRLWLTARSLKGYHDSKHEAVEVDGAPMLQVTVSDVVRGKAGEVIESATPVVGDLRCTAGRVSHSDNAHT
jgi:hypothetical protein